MHSTHDRLIITPTCCTRVIHIFDTQHDTWLPRVCRVRGALVVSCEGLCIPTAELNLYITKLLDGALRGVQLGICDGDMPCTIPS